MFDVPLHKLVSITIDAAKSMTRQVNGFLALRSQHDDFPDLLSYQCIIYQQVLASKKLNTKTVMDIAFKIVNSLLGKSLQIWLLNLTPEEGTPDIVLLNRYTFLERFRGLLSEIKIV
jgi:hypothetical protein